MLLYILNVLVEKHLVGGKIKMQSYTIKHMNVTKPMFSVSTNIQGRAAI